METQIPHWKQLHYFDATLFDLHAHPSLKQSLFDRTLTKKFKASRFFNPLSVRTDFPKLQQGGLDVLLSTVYAPEKNIIEDCKILKFLRLALPQTWKKVFARPYFQVAMDMLTAMEKAVAAAKNPDTDAPIAQVAYSVSDLEKILAQGPTRPIAVIHNIEGAHTLDGDLAHLDQLFQRGVAYLTLAHFYENDAVYPCFPYPEKMHLAGCFGGMRNLALGLKPFGQQVIERMMELGMLLDITHCTPPARQQIYDMVQNRMPIFASHIGAYEVNPNPYNLKDWEIRRIADTGGLAAVIFMNYWLMPHETKRGLDFIARTINHFVNVGGIDHVGIGTDFDGFTDPPDDLKDAGGLPNLTQRLLAEGYSDEDIIKIWGGNALRMLREGWRKT